MCLRQCSPGLPGTHYEAQVGFELVTIVLPQSLECWDSNESHHIQFKNKNKQTKTQTYIKPQRDLKLFFTATGPDHQPFNFAVSDEVPLDVCLIINYYIIVHYF